MSQKALIPWSKPMLKAKAPAKMVVTYTPRKKVGVRRVVLDWRVMSWLGLTVSLYEGVVERVGKLWVLPVNVRDQCLIGK